MSTRLSAALLSRCPQYVNPLQEREIDIRGHNIQVIEAEPLQLLNDEFDTIDLSENYLSRLDNFPTMKRLSTLLIHNNRVSKISKFLAAQLPQLKSLIVNNNQIQELSDLDVFAHFTSLQRLSLIGNPVSKKPYYRFYLIVRCPSVKLIDFQRVTDKERESAKAMFPPSAILTTEKPLTREERRKQRQDRRARLEAGCSPLETSGGASVDPKEAESTLQERIANATSLEEMEQLEEELKMLRRRKRQKVE